VSERDPAAPPVPGRVAIARAGEVAPGGSKRFLLDCAGREIPGFLVNVAGRLHAYVNRCRHVPMELDWVENQFYTEDGAYLQCATHGALYVPESGECIAGPPCGRALARIAVEVGDGVVWATCPGPLPDDV
jgi:nitrite reductase/ring-hydroxylating ferredoxin subunit